MLTYFLEGEDNKASKLAVDDNEGSGGSNHEQRSACISPASSQGGIYPVKIIINYIIYHIHINQLTILLKYTYIGGIG